MSYISVSSKPSKKFFIYIFGHLTLTYKVCIYIYIYIYIYNHENNMPSRLSPQWLCGNSCTWAHDVRLGGHIVFMITYILRSSCFCEI